MLKSRVVSFNSSRLALAQQLPPSKQPGYRIRGSKLQFIRQKHFRLHPLCKRCSSQGITKAATELDHIIALSNGGKDIESNRQGLCDECHRIKTLDDMRQI